MMAFSEKTSALSSTPPPNPNPCLNPSTASAAASASASAPRHSHSSSSSPCHSPEVHVLAVDDSILDRKVIERLLRTSSYKVTVVDSGIKALEFLGIEGAAQRSMRMNVSLIITDYCMPGMSGYELLKRVKETSSLSEIPVVIMSSENVPARIQRCLEEGAKEFIMKPVQMADVERIKAHIMCPISSHVIDHHHQHHDHDHRHHHHQQHRRINNINNNKRKQLEPQSPGRRTRRRCPRLRIAA